MVATIPNGEGAQPMIVPRDHVAGYLRSHGREAEAERAVTELPDPVDVHAQEAVLTALGVDLDALLDHEPEHLAERMDPEGLQPY